MKKNKYVKCARCGKKIHVDDLALINKKGMWHKKCAEIERIKGGLRLNTLKEKIDPKKIKIYCKNPECFNHYLANHKIKEVKE